MAWRWRRVSIDRHGPRMLRAAFNAFMKGSCDASDGVGSILADGRVRLLQV